MVMVYRDAAPKELDPTMVIYCRIKNKVATTPFVRDAAVMALEGQSAISIHTFLMEKGVSIHVTTVERFRSFITKLSDEDKRRILGLPLLEVPDGEQPLTSVQILVNMMASVGKRIKSLEEAAKDKLLSEKNEQQLREYYALYMEYRKTLEKERIKSEVAYAQRQALIGVGHIALNFIMDSDEKRRFIQKVRDYEKSLGLID